MSGSNTISMMEYSVDIADAVPPPPLPAREYHGVEIVGASFQVSPFNGVIYLNLQWRVNADQYPADFEGEPDGTMVYGRVRASNDMAGQYAMQQAMQKIGGPMGQHIDPNSLIGLHGNIDVIHYTGDDGLQRSKVKQILPA